jgi:hypothetical protein
VAEGEAAALNVIVKQGARSIRARRAGRLHSYREHRDPARSRGYVRPGEPESPRSVEDVRPYLAPHSRRQVLRLRPGNK